MNRKRTAALFYMLLILVFGAAAERTSPAAFYIAVDKSLSAGKSGLFDDMIEWIDRSFLQNTFISGDKVTVFAFYGKTDIIIETSITSAADIENIRTSLKNIAADGKFTDIGTAADTVRKKIQSDGFKLPVFSCICTDLLQEAPYTSPYAGTYYFPEYRLQTNSIITHTVNGRKSSAWFQIALPVEKNVDVEKTALKLYSIASLKKR